VGPPLPSSGSVPRKLAFTDASSALRPSRALSTPSGLRQGFWMLHLSAHLLQRASPFLNRATPQQHGSTQSHAQWTQADNKTWIFSPFSCNSACAGHGNTELPISFQITVELEPLHCREWGNMKLKSPLGPPVIQHRHFLFPCNLLPSPPLPGGSLHLPFPHSLCVQHKTAVSLLFPTSPSPP